MMEMGLVLYSEEVEPGRVTGILRYSGNPAREICPLIEGHEMRNKPCRTKTM